VVAAELSSLLRGLKGWRIAELRINGGSAKEKRMTNPWQA